MDDKMQKGGKLRILYISDSRMPSVRANSVQIAKTCEALASNGCEVTLLLPNRAENKKYKDEDIWEYYKIKTRFKTVRLPVIDISLLERLHMKKLWFFISTQTFARSVNRYIKENPDFDFIYTRHAESIGNLSRSKRTKTKLVFEAHKFSDSKYNKARNADAIITITGPLADIYSALDRPVAVVPDATDAEFFKPKSNVVDVRAKLGLPQGKVILAYLGRFQTMGEEKGVKEIIQSVKNLDKDARKKAFFLFVGGPLSSVPQYQTIISEEGLDKRMFDFRDHVPYAQVGEYLNAVDICLMPFPNTEHYAKYMSPLKMFEYMAAKKPIIATRLPSVQEVLKDGKTALFAEPGDSASLGAVESKAILDNSLRVRLSEAAYELLQENYTWDKRATKILAFMRGLKK